VSPRRPTQRPSTAVSRRSTQRSSRCCGDQPAARQPGAPQRAHRGHPAGGIWCATDSSATNAGSAPRRCGPRSKVAGVRWPARPAGPR
jgi:hypothetical protein